MSGEHHQWTFDIKCACAGWKVHIHVDVHTWNTRHLLTCLLKKPCLSLVQFKVAYNNTYCKRNMQREQHNIKIRKQGIKIQKTLVETNFFRTWKVIANNLHCAWNSPVTDHHSYGHWNIFRCYSYHMKTDKNGHTGTSSYSSIVGQLNGHGWMSEESFSTHQAHNLTLALTFTNSLHQVFDAFLCWMSLSPPSSLFFLKTGMEDMPSITAFQLHTSQRGSYLAVRKTNMNVG